MGASNALERYHSDGGVSFEDMAFESSGNSAVTRGTPSRRAESSVAWIRFADRIIEPHDPNDGDRIRRTRLAVLLVVTVSVMVATLGVVTLAIDSRAGFVMLGMAAALSVTLMVLRTTRSLSMFGNMVAALWVTCPLIVVFQRGTLVSPEAMVLGLASLFAIMFGGAPRGALWLAIELAALSVATIVLGDTASHAASPLAFAIVVFAISFAFEWTRGAALNELKSSETHRRRTEQEMALLRADRMASMGQLAAGVAHEINNPLAYVVANCDFIRGSLERGETPDDDWHEAVNETLEGAERIQRIVRELKAFTRVDAEQELATVSLASVLERSLKFAKPELKQRARVREALADVGSVEADAVRLSQVFVNLLVNAAHALQDRDGTIDVGVKREGDRVVAYVRDDGPGIPPDVLERVFDPFFTTKPVGEGTGLGLPVSRGIVESMGGELRLESEVGRGTTVFVDLPLATPEPDAASPSLVPKEPPPRRRWLVVDDDELVLRSVRRLLYDHDVTCVAEPEEGLGKMVASPSAWDIILCDITMPGMSGIEVHRKLAEQESEAASRMTFMTGGVFSGEAKTFIQDHPSRVLEKPLSRAALLALVESPT